MSSAGFSRSQKNHHYIQGQKYGHLASAIPESKYRLIIGDVTWTHGVLADPGAYSQAALNICGIATVWWSRVTPSSMLRWVLSRRRSYDRNVLQHTRRLAQQCWREPHVHASTIHKCCEASAMMVMMISPSCSGQFKQQMTGLSMLCSRLATILII